MPKKSNNNNPSKSPNDDAMLKAQGEQLKSLHQLYSTKCEELGDMSEALKVTKESLAEKSSENVQLQSKLERMEALVTKLSKELESTKLALESKQQLVDGLIQQLNDTEKNLGNKAEALEQEVDVLKNHLDQNQRDLQSKEQRMEQLKHRVLYCDKGIEMGREHIKRLTAFISQQS